MDPDDFPFTEGAKPIHDAGLLGKIEDACGDRVSDDQMEHDAETVNNERDEKGESGKIAVEVLEW